jgi:hypothetical protein
VVTPRDGDERRAGSRAGCLSEVERDGHRQVARAIGEAQSATQVGSLPVGDVDARLLHQSRRQDADALAASHPRARQRRAAGAFRTSASRGSSAATGRIDESKAYTSRNAPSPNIATRTCRHRCLSALRAAKGPPGRAGTVTDQDLVESTTVGPRLGVVVMRSRATAPHRTCSGDGNVRRFLQHDRCFGCGEWGERVSLVGCFVPPARLLATSVDEPHDERRLPRANRWRNCDQCTPSHDRTCSATAHRIVRLMNPAILYLDAANEERRYATETSRRPSGSAA